jgi:hypothetical protein
MTFSFCLKFRDFFAEFEPIADRFVPACLVPGP